MRLSHARTRQVPPPEPGRALCVLTLLCLAVPLQAAEVFTPRDVASIQTVTDVVIAPDGDRVAYLLSVPRKLFDEPDGPAWSELRVVDRAGKARAYVSGKAGVSQVAWTPGGRALSFVEKRDGDDHARLYRIPVDGGEARPVLDLRVAIASYAWSPDGKRLAYAAPDAPDADAKRRREQGFTQEVFEETWTRQRLWVVAVDGEGRASSEPRKLELDGFARDVAWDPTGERLAVVTTPTPFVDDRYLNQRIVTLDPDDGEIWGGYRPPGKMGEFRWSPDGRRLAVISTADRNDPAAGRLVVVSARGNDAGDVLPGLEAHVAAIEWLDETTLAYVADLGTGSTLGLRKLGAAEAGAPAEQPLVVHSLSLAENGSAAAVCSSPRHPAEVCFYESLAEMPRRLTDHNPWTAERRFARQELVAYRARDGLRLEGVLIRPLDEKPGRRYPLIVSVHGGPESRIDNGWRTSYSQPGQVAAARGFAVFYPNYRASTGRGVEFSKLNHGDPAGAEFDDLVDGVDHLISSGLVDRARVGITGGSYGGYASAWAATKLTERFAAAVAFVGITDLISKAPTTDIPEEIFETHHRKRLWENWDLFLERSPISYAEQARTPLLLLHGKRDTRVPPHQSLELYRLLKEIGKTPVRLVWYPDEGHGNRRAAARYDYNLRMLRWFEHYLKGPGGDPPPPEVLYEPTEGAQKKESP